MWLKESWPLPAFSFIKIEDAGLNTARGLVNSKDLPIEPTNPEEMRQGGYYS
jgi:hypothetical protein